jgi:NADH-quinone oxidoreductase subunit H
MDWIIWVEWILKGFVLCMILLTGFAYLTLYERRALARIQVRVGPNRAGPQGLLQPIADAVKLIFKEELTPGKVYKVVFILAPVLTVVPSLIIAAVIPLGDTFTLFGREITLYVANLNVGILYLMSIASIAVYGIVLAGWSSNNKYAMLGGIRSSAQMISYELSLGLCFVTAILLGNSMNLIDIVNAQKDMWFAVIQPAGALVFMDRNAGGSEPRPVRYARSRAGIDRRLPCGILRHEVRPVLHGGISEDDRYLHDRGDTVLRRLP